VKILVILGNPPYNGFAGVAVAEERDLTNAYRATNRAPAPQGHGLNDLYVRFYRMAERRIVEMSGRGVVCFISNYSWLDGLSFTGMRERYLDAFDCVWIDCLNGDKYKTGKLTPEGDPDPSVFSTEFSPEGIQVGTAIALLARTAAVPAVEMEKGQGDAGAAGVRFRHLWGKTKRQRLLETAAQDGESLYEQLRPPLELGLPFAPARVDTGYLAWPLLPDLFPVSFPGVKTSRDDVVVDIDRERLTERMKMYFDPKVNHEEMRRACPSAMTSTARFDAEAARDYLRKRGLLEKNVVQYHYRPFDVRWLYWEPETKLLDEKRAEYFPHVFEGNVWIEARQKQAMQHFDRGYVVRVLADNFGNGLSNFFPLLLKEEQPQASLPTQASDTGVQANVSDRTIAYIECVGGGGPEVFYHSIATLHAPAYRQENADALRQNWPRIPLPDSAELLLSSAQLGKRVAALLDTNEEPFGDGLPLLKLIGVPARVGGGALQDAELALTAGWGHAGKGGATMPGKGRIVGRGCTSEERSDLERAAAVLSARRAQKPADRGDVLTLYRGLSAAGFGKFKSSGEITIEQYGALGATDDLRKAQHYAHRRGGAGGKVIKFTTLDDPRYITDSPQDPGEFRIRAAFKPLSWEEVPSGVAERQIPVGSDTLDVYLNDDAYWRNIPVRVWEYTIGGYQVIKKWLSYREQKLLGRPITKDEVRWVQEMARRIAAILLLEPALDDNYHAVKAHTYDWTSKG
jgi:hypothetical protein